MIKRLSGYDRAIKSLYDELVQMGGAVDEMLSQAMQSLLAQDVRLANAVIDHDDRIDDWDYELERQALELILLQQPRDVDLRILASVMRITKDLERIADYAVNIAETAIRLSSHNACFKQSADINRMNEMAKSMLKKSIQACVERNTSLAQEVGEEDQMLDDFFTKVYDELINCMKEEPMYVEQASSLTMVARFLERIGDHAVNVAEMVIYMVTGERRPFAEKGAHLPVMNS